MCRAPLAIRALLLVAPLAGCAGGADVPGDSLRSSLDASRASLRAIQGDRPATAAPALPAPAPSPVAAAPPGPPAPPPPPPRRAGGAPPAAAGELLQQSAETVRAVLGAPSLRRAEGPAAEIWLYEAPRCRLDLILYREAGGALRVAHAQARSAGMAPVTEAECLGDIAGGRATPPAWPPRA